MVSLARRGIPVALGCGSVAAQARRDCSPVLADTTEGGGGCAGIGVQGHGGGGGRPARCRAGLLGTPPRPRRLWAAGRGLLFVLLHSGFCTRSVRVFKIQIKFCIFEQTQNLLDILLLDILVEARYKCYLSLEQNMLDAGHRLHTHDLM